MKLNWRKDELSLKEFRQLPSTEREEYLLLLQGINQEYLGINDSYILSLHDKPQEIKKQKNFFEL